MQVEAKLKSLNLEVVGDLLQIPMAFWQAGYNKDEEFEADREGLQRAAAAGYSPYGAVETFERFLKLCNEQSIQAVDPAGRFPESFVLPKDRAALEVDWTATAAQDTPWARASINARS